MTQINKNIQLLKCSNIKPPQFSFSKCLETPLTTHTLWQKKDVMLQRHYRYIILFIYRYVYLYIYLIIVKNGDVQFIAHFQQKQTASKSLKLFALHYTMAETDYPLTVSFCCVRKIVLFFQSQMRRPHCLIHSAGA